MHTISILLLLLLLLLLLMMMMMLLLLLLPLVNQINLKHYRENIAQEIKVSITQLILILILGPSSIPHSIKSTKDARPWLVCENVHLVAGYFRSSCSQRPPDEFLSRLI